MRTLTALLYLAVVAHGCGENSGMPPAASDAALDRVVSDVVDGGAVGADVSSADATPDAPTMARLTWRQVPTMGAGPFGRWGYMVAERGDGTAIIQGGTTLTNAGVGRVFNETWLFDGRSATPSFTRVETMGAVPGRYCGCVGYDPRRDTMVMVGGRTPAVSSADTWQLSLSTRTWTQSTTTTTPPGVIGCMMAWSEARAALYLFGGGNMSGYLGNLWRFDATAGTWSMLEATGPRGRYDGVLRAIEGGRTFVLYGGSRSAAASGTFFGDVWRFDVMNERWTELTANGEAPAPRRTPWVSIEPGESAMIVGFGNFGLQPEEAHSDVWRFEFATQRWTRLTFNDDGPAPSARGFIHALPAGARAGGWLLGGFDNTAPINDLWHLTAKQ